MFAEIRFGFFRVPLEVVAHGSILLFECEILHRHNGSVTGSPVDTRAAQAIGPHHKKRTSRGSGARRVVRRYCSYLVGDGLKPLDLNRVLADSD